MPIQGKFDADFASFTAACDGAELSLKRFESGGASVEKQLNRVADSLTGTKLIAQATLMAEAVERIGGPSRLTAAELDKVGKSAADAADKLRAWGQDVPQRIQTLADTVRPVPSLFQDLGVQVAATTLGFISGQAIISGFQAAYGALSNLITASISSYSQAESAQVKLVGALRQHALATPQVIEQYGQLATTFQRTTVYADEEITAMERLLTQVGGLMPSQMRGALKASTDLAAGLGIDLNAATLLVAKAAAGHTETLGRYGITVTQAALETKGFDAVLEAINRQFGGSAAADVDTYAGKIKQAANAWDNVQEAIGKFIITDPLVQKAIRTLTEGAADLDAKSTKATISIGDWIENSVALTPVLGDVAKAAVLAARNAELLADAENEIAKAQEGLRDLPLPFEAWQKENALPAITAGMKLFNEEVAAHEQAVRAAKEADDKYAAAWAELDTVGGSLQQTIEGIDGTIVENVKQALAAGASQATLATAYGLTAAQVKAVTAELAIETETMKIQTEIEKTTFGLAMEHNKQWRTEALDTAQRVNAAVLAELDAQQHLNAEYGRTVDGQIKVTDATETYRASLDKLHQAKVEGISQEQQEQVLIDAYTQAMRTEAMAQDQMVQSLQQIPAAASAAAGSVQQLNGTIRLGISDINEYNRAIHTFYDQFTGNGLSVGTPGLPNMPAPTPGGNQPRFLGQASPSVWITTPANAGRASGGPVMAGQSYMVGERGPELYTPTTNGTITPNGGGGGVTTNVTIYVNGTAEDVARQVAAKILQTVSAGQKLRLNG